MRNIYITITAVIFCAILFSCTTDQTSFQVQKQKAGPYDQLNNMENSIMRKGHMLSKTECTECHRFYSPEEYTHEEWDRIIKEKAKRLSLRKDQVDALDLFFQSENRKKAGVIEP